MWGKKAPYNVGGVGKCVGVKIARVKSRGFSCGVFSCVWAAIFLCGRVFACGGF